LCSAHRRYIALDQRRIRPISRGNLWTGETVGIIRAAEVCGCQSPRSSTESEVVSGVSNHRGGVDYPLEVLLGDP